MPLGQKGELIAEGKTKKLYRLGAVDVLLMESTDAMTKGDGEVRVEIPGKGAASTQTCINILDYLENNGIRTHLVDSWFRPNEMVVDPCDMLKIEVVVRGVARGSYLKRNLEATEGQKLDPPVVEFYYKDDKEHDPLIVYDRDQDQFLLYVASKPLEEQTPKILGRSQTLTENHDHWIIDLLGFIETTALTVYVTLRDAFSKQEAEMDDIKIEFGFNDQGELLVADVIDADSFRIIYLGKERSKQVFRDAKEITEELIREIQENYSLITDLSSKLKEEVS